jgi:DNA-binding CsgD family transcriptional regulator
LAHPWSRRSHQRHWKPYAAEQHCSPFLQGRFADAVVSRARERSSSGFGLQRALRDLHQLAERGLIRRIMEAGANGYILKDDRTTLIDLANVVLTIASGGIHFSQRAHQLFLTDQLEKTGVDLSTRQLQALSLCAAYPDALTTELSKEMAVANSTFRNLLSGAYIKLNVRTRAAAITKAQSLGIITPLTPSAPIVG